MTAAPPDSPTAVAPSGMPAIARGGLLNLAGAAVAAVAGVALTIAVTRGLPQDAAGTFFTLTSLFLLAEMVARLGTGTGLVYFIARLRALGSPHRIRAFQRVALAPVVVVSLVVSAVLIGWAPAWARLVGGDGDATRTAVVLLAVLLPVTALSDTLLSATRGFATMLPTVTLDRIGRPLVQLVLVAVTAGGGSLVLLSGAWALPWAGSAVLAWLWLRRLGAGLPEGPGDPGPAPWREFWSFTWARAINSLAALALQRLDIILVTALSGPAEAAVYTAASRFLVVGQLTSTAVATAAQPRLAELLALGDRASAKALYQSATAWVVLLTWPFYLVCVVLADVILMVFGEGYADGRPVVLVLAGAMLLATACGMVDMLLNMAGRTSWTLANSLVALAVMIVVDLALIPPLGMLGAGIGWAAAILTNNLLPLAQLWSTMGLHPFGRATLGAAALSAACFGLLPGTAVLVLPDDTLVVPAAIVLGGAAFAVIALGRRTALGLPPFRSLRHRRTPPPRADVAHPSPGEEQ